MSDEPEPTLKDVMELLLMVQSRSEVRFDRVQTQVDRMHEQLTAIREDIAVNMARADLALSAVEVNRIELNGMWRQLKRLETHIDDIEKKAS